MKSCSLMRNKVPTKTFQFFGLIKSHSFSVACTRLYKPLCQLVRRSVGPSVGRCSRSARLMAIGLVYQSVSLSANGGCRKKSSAIRILCLQRANAAARMQSASGDIATSRPTTALRMYSERAKIQVLSFLVANRNSIGGFIHQSVG